MLLLLALGLDGLFVAYRLRSALPRAATRLHAGGVALSEAHYQRAREQFALARAEAGEARELLRHPSFLLGSELSPIEADFRALEALTRAAELSSRAGGAGVKAVEKLGRNGFGSLYEGGRVRFDVLRRVAPYLASARRLLSTASVLVARVPEPSLGQVRDPLREASAELATASSSAQQAVAALHALPGLLGKDSPQRYFLALQTPSEARGTGGLAGFYGVLEAAGGRMSLESIGPITELASSDMAGVEAPLWFQRRYASLAGLRQWQQANLSPHFPVVSRVWLDMYEAVRGERLDGVIAMDPVALGLLSTATGPIAPGKLGLSVGPDNAARVLLHDSYLRFGDASERQNRYLAGVTREFWNALAEDEVDVAALAAGAGRSIGSGHIKVFSRTPATESALRTLDADGGVLHEGRNVQLVYHNNFAANKVDYFLRRRIRTRVQLDQSGGAQVRTIVDMRNEAPSGPPSPLLGPGVRGEKTGMNRMALELLLPQRARMRELTIGGRPVPPWTEREGKLPAVSATLGIPPGERKIATFTYFVPDAATWSGEDGEFEMTLLPHTTVTPDRFSLKVVAPDGYRIESWGPEATTRGGTLRLEGVLDQKQSVELRIVS